jgi:hypothetical protein
MASVFDKMVCNKKFFLPITSLLKVILTCSPNYHFNSKGKIDHII